MSDDQSDLLTIEEKQKQIFDRIQRRDAERMKSLEKRKQIRKEDEVESEKTSYFNETFNGLKEEIKNKVVKAGDLEKSELPDYLDAVSKELQQLQKFVGDSAMFLTSYEVAKAQEVLKNLQLLLVEKEDELLPKKKFGFRGKKARQKPSKVLESKPADTADSGAPSADTFKIECGFSHRIGETLQLDAETVKLKDVQLENLKDCAVYIRGAPSTLHITSLQHCRVFTGPVSTSIFIEDCTDCTFVIACQQLRTHATHDTHFYLHVTSRAIVEDCRQILVAPYNWSYPQLDEHFALVGLSRSTNNWDSLDDFNWLSADKHSPNWSILPADRRVQSWD